jgi:hypothetical protein
LIEKATHVTLFWNLARNPEKNSSKIRRKNAKFEFVAIELMNFINSIAFFFLAIFDEKNGSRERCKGVHCVDLGESFPTSIYLQKSASIQPRTSPSKFGGKYSLLFTGVLTQRTEEEFSSGPTFPTDGTGAPLAHRTKTTALAGTKMRRKPFRNMKMKTKTKISQIVFLVLDFELSVSFWGREDKQCQTA